MDDNEPQILEENMSTYEVTCYTPECGNYGSTIQVSAESDNPRVVCGPCGQILVAVSVL